MKIYRCALFMNADAPCLYCRTSSPILYRKNQWSMDDFKRKSERIAHVFGDQSKAKPKIPTRCLWGHNFPGTRNFHRHPQKGCDRNQLALSRTIVKYSIGEKTFEDNWKMRITVAQGDYHGIVCPPAFLGKAIRAMMRNIAACTIAWFLMVDFDPNHSQTTAMKASPHTFVVDQDDEDIILKIKGDESDHWVTNQHGKKESLAKKALNFDRLGIHCMKSNVSFFSFL